MSKYWWVYIFFLFSIGLGNADINKSTNELSSVKMQLKKAKISLQGKEIEKSNIEKQIKFIDAQLSSYEQKMKQINSDIGKQRSEMASIKRQIRETNLQIVTTKKRVAKLLTHQYKKQFPNVLILIMQNTNPNDKMRKMGYLRYLQESQRQSFLLLQQRTTELTSLKTELQKKIRSLSDLVAINQKLKKQAEIKKREQMKLKHTIEIDIGQNKRTIKSLQASENKLNQLVRGLVQQHRRPLSTMKQKQPQEIQKKGGVKAVNRTLSVQGNLTQEDFSLIENNSKRIVDTSESLINSTFSQHKGSLNLPVRQGHIQQYYGQKRDDGGIVKGFVIESASDLPVLSVGDGVIVYAGEMQGYGNMVLIMHDSVYVSVYAGLSQINVAKGQHVKLNTTIGKTGLKYDGKTGLYFELRENTRPVNPRSWFK